MDGGQKRQEQDKTSGSHIKSEQHGRLWERKRDVPVINVIEMIETATKTGRN